MEKKDSVGQESIGMQVSGPKVVVFSSVINYKIMLSRPSVSCNFYAVSLSNADLYLKQFFDRQRLFTTIFNPTRLANGEGSTLGMLIFDIELVSLRRHQVLP